MRFLSDRTAVILFYYVVPGVLLCSLAVNIALSVIVALNSTKHDSPTQTDGSRHNSNRSASIRAGADPTAIYWGRFEPTRTARLSIPYKNFRVLIYEPAPSVNENPLTARRDLYYYTPAAILNVSSAVSSNNKFAGKFQVEFSILMWDGDYVAHIRREISERLNVPNPKLRIIPIEEVRVDLISPDWSKTYEIDNDWRPYSMAPMYVPFRFFCTTKNECLDLKDDITRDPEHFLSDLVMYYNLQSKTSSARRLTVNVEFISTGKLFSELRTRFTGSTDVYLSGADAKELTTEIATNLLAAEISDADFVDQESSPKLMQLIESALELSTESSKNFDAAKWRSVFWKDENARPDKVTYRLNEAYSKLDRESQLLIKEAHLRKDETNLCFNLTGKYQSGKDKDKDKGKGKDKDKGKGEASKQLWHAGTDVGFSDPFHHMRSKRGAGDCGCPPIQCSCYICGCNTNVMQLEPKPITTTTRSTTTTTTTTTPVPTRPPRPTHPPGTTEEEEEDDEDSPTTTTAPTNTTAKPKDKERDVSGTLKACIPQSTQTNDTKAQEEFNKYFEESRNFSEFQGEKFEVKTMSLKRLNLASLVSRTTFQTSSIRLQTVLAVMRTNINLDLGQATPVTQDTEDSETEDDDTSRLGIGKDVREVFFVRANVTSAGFNPAHAAHMCLAFNSRLATARDMRQAWVNGANWCNLGHIKPEGSAWATAVYPNRNCFADGVKETYAPEVCISDPNRVKASLLQEVIQVIPNPSDGRINETFVNGVNCYGIKPQDGDEIYYSGIRMLVSYFRNGVYMQPFQ
ncbi:uncharacterized protein LOC129597552 [Paramacrobiotus metropolitanus]|uniref:uncharacterized protein LOC129597552 n=1 Tax=Paramacrobiotus metropolitanus TaxID=2943436 RepID=UPI002445B901|nr:uncharacterized protein LOC129597552 [Paramacrobiotus metropolitanus]